SVTLSSDEWGTFLPAWTAPGPAHRTRVPKGGGGVGANTGARRSTPPDWTGAGQREKGLQPTHTSETLFDYNRDGAHGIEMGACNRDRGTQSRRGHGTESEAWN